MLQEGKILFTMKKRYIILTFLIILPTFLFAQIKNLFSENNDDEFNLPTHAFEFSLSYMQMKENLVATSRFTDIPTWHGIGIGGAAGLFHKNNMSAYVDMFLDLGWNDDYTTFNMPICANVGFDIWSIKEKNIYLTPHLGLGFMIASLQSFDDNNIGGYFVYDDEHLSQISGCIPFGIKFYYKKIFFDFSYRMRFLKSKISIEENSSDTEILYDKRSENRINNIKIFPCTFSLGYCF